MAELGERTEIGQGAEVARVTDHQRRSFGRDELVDGGAVDGAVGAERRFHVVLTGVSGETERAVGLVVGRFENMWTGRIDAINEHIDSRTKAVADALDGRMTSLAETIKTNSVEAAQVIGRAGAEAERAVASITGAASDIGDRRDMCA